MNRICTIAILCLLGSCVALQPGMIRPAHFPEPLPYAETITGNTAQVLLGRALFYDPVLSADSTISCASCHSSYTAFAHTDHALSHGINDMRSTRNAPALFNLAWQSAFMWDGAIQHLDMQALAPINSPTEMGEQTAHVIEKLQRSGLYRRLFSMAYGDTVVTGERMLKALSAFQLTFVSANAKYDSVMLGKSRFTEQEAKGYGLFKQYCNSCHTEPLFTNGGFANNGLQPETLLMDPGRYKVTRLPSDSLMFKIPSLRNLSYSYPYMHDGRFNKLGQVLTHYTSQKNISPTLSPALNEPMPLSSNDKVDLIAFLLTLNDRSFIQNPAYKYPFEIFDIK